jgi:hypothetical protein
MPIIFILKIEGTGEQGVQENIFVGGRTEQEARGNCITRSFITVYSSPDTSRAIKSREMNWVRHAARMGDVRIVGRNILKWILK